MMKKARRTKAVATQKESQGETLQVNLGGRMGEVNRSEYVTAKTKQLREFGYPTVTQQEINEQITALLEGKTFGNGLTVIGMFMDDEIIIDAPSVPSASKRSTASGKQKKP